ncbi:muconolactone Delta-isomerase family protein [Mycobacterium sp.]|uniref:muconolactone Delta-isomerase family protein n=1 Tax=Mycobacterium sp. TaxID=1785 RepID=UPI002CBE8B64|nr:muconolactone Delta-isomerase family protein [Mycobacterium sp.]HXB89101.1 muconolactone Delta-isomerase family protein [Mycobacterium sp.]
MEFLVTMTTNVPAGTPDEAIDEVRGREAARSRELAVGGNLRRLWRPPLKPGEWRTLGLFAADDADELERLLASMPLRVWRTDEVTPLSPHSNDPALSGPGSGQEFLITMTIAVPEGTSSAAVDDAMKREAQRARELAASGHLKRLWAMATTQTGDRRTLGLWNASDVREMDGIVESLPLYSWMTLVIIPLTVHPSDPANSH